MFSKTMEFCNKGMVQADPPDMVKTIFLHFFGPFPKLRSRQVCWDANKHARLVKVQSLEISQCWNILSARNISSHSVKVLTHLSFSQVVPFQTPMGHDNTLGCQHCHPAAPISPLLSVHVWSTKNAGPINVRVISFTLIFLGLFFFCSFVAPLVGHTVEALMDVHMFLVLNSDFCKNSKNRYKT